MACFLLNVLVKLGAWILILLFSLQYTQYDAAELSSSLSAAAAASTGATEVKVDKADSSIKDDKADKAQKPIVEEAEISGKPAAQPPRVVAQEERIEYRDQDGNILDPEQVKELEGKVEFKTRYETRTRVIDENGNEVQVDVEEGEGVAPPHPDVQNVDQETKQKESAGDSKVVPDAAESIKGEREAEVKKPKPASEGGPEASAHEEL